MNKIKELIEKFNIRGFIKYGLVGVANTIVDFVVFYLLNSLLNVAMIPAQIISFLAGALNSYLLNRKWTFKVAHNVSKGEVFRFCLGKAGYLLCNLLLLEFFTWLLPISAFVAKFPTAVILIFFNYLYDKIVVFLVKNKE